MKLPSRLILEQIVDAVREGIAVVDTGKPDWTIGWFNQEFARVTARRAGALANQSGRDLIERLGGSTALNRVVAAIGAREPASLTLMPGEPVSSRPPLSLHVRPLVNRDKTFSGSYLLLLRAQDAEEHGDEHDKLKSELAAFRRQVRDMGDDAVTGLASERRFRQQLARDWSLALRESYALSLIGLRVDAFQAYLDTFGEHAADSCLRMLARTVRRRLRRDSDFAGRIGRETLVVLMSGGEDAAVAEFAATLADDVRALHIHHPHSPVARYVTVAHRCVVAHPAANDGGPDTCFDALLDELSPAPESAKS